MCRKLTVCCQRFISKNVSVSDHHIIFSDLKVPCIEPGTAKCRSGEADLKDFQNPPTTCAGAAEGYPIRSSQCEAVCHAALRKYGESLHRMNTAGPAKKGWWASWFGKREEGDVESSDKGLFVVSRDPEDRPYKESRASMDG